MIEVADDRIYPFYKTIHDVFYSVRDNITFGFASPWKDAATTIRLRGGHCGMKAEVLAEYLRNLAYVVRFVYSRNTHINSTITKRVLCALGLKLFDAHIWVQVDTPLGWLDLDPSTDAGVAPCFGNIKPGMHLGTPESITYYNYIPPRFKHTYNAWYAIFFKIMPNLEMRVRRRIYLAHTRRVNEFILGYLRSQPNQ